MARKSRKHIAEPIFTSVSPFINTALYIRLSVEDNKKRGNSIETQKMVLKDYLSNKPEFRIYDTYIDNGTTGTNFNREGFQRMLSDIEAGKIDCVIVKDLSRLGRNSIDSGYYIEQYFPSHNVRFIAVTDQFDSENPDNLHGGIILPLKNMINEAYSLDIGRKIKAQARQDMKEGKFVGARAPFGYKKDPDDCHMKMRRGEYQSKICPYGYCKGDNNRMVPDPETSCVIQMIFEYAASGMNSAQIARELHSQAIPTPGEYKALKGQKYHDVSRTNGVWSNSTILRLLADERYIGTYVIGKKTVTEIGGNRMRTKDESEWIKIPNHHTPLVSKELFEKANASIKRFKIPKRKQHSYPLRGKVFCGSCKHAMHRSNETIYRCRFSYMDSSQPCYGMTIRESELESIVYEFLCKQFEVSLGIDGPNELKPVDKVAVRRAEFDNQIFELQEEKRKLYEALVIKQIDVNLYKEQKALIEQRYLSFLLLSVFQYLFPKILVLSLQKYSFYKMM